ncbi:bifunctional DNA-formamidopyrimidine glycosylase/DNA-(apurinic or apyrimidinic site) lyase [Brevibacterium jeotgali]|uniref:bifunctional DNA-formamidopyrimidine glycosylase/DNA-(apurinic or apyrimidinic site) lyase n=1 Tax=Brevibacterium jeotgali TaxID=1262550 RepID=UPI000C791165|nr:bifunctional DNA-formamidopyrimidine glycosylase/DNA-(apurinic or apyrimidinic site) lyase [Brevibacterium jeotgali]
MPELPEVESVRRGLRHWITGARVTEARVLDPRILGTTSQRRIPPEAVDAFAEAVAGISLRAPQRRGKFLWVPFDRPCGSGAQPQPPSSALALHLGMSGQLRVHTAHEELHRHTRAVLTLEPGHASAPASGSPSGPPAARGEGRLELRFLDQRIFGHIGVDDLVPDGPDSLPRHSSHIARDPLDPHWDAEATARVVQRSRAALKSVLMDQTVVSGVGNIYADEALHRAGVHPQAVPSRLRISRIRRVLDESRIVMLEALAQGGTSFDALYVHVNGDSGYFERSLRVYGRAGRPCGVCGEHVRRIVVGARGTHFCPQCQRAQRLPR